MSRASGASVSRRSRAGTSAYQVLDTLSYFTGPHQFKAGFDFNYIDATEQSLPLHFGGRYIFGSIPAAQAPLLGLPPVEVPAIVAVSLAFPGGTSRGTATRRRPTPTATFRCSRRTTGASRSRLTAKLGVRYQVQAFGPKSAIRLPAIPAHTRSRAITNNVAPRLGLVWDPLGDRRTTVHGAYGLYFDNLDHRRRRDHERDQRPRSCAHARRGRTATAIGAWNAPGRRLPEPTTAYPSLVISLDPGLETPYAHHAVGGNSSASCPGRISLSADFIYVRGFKQPSTLDYNPLVPSLGQNRRPRM